MLACGVLYDIAIDISDPKPRVWWKRIWGKMVVYTHFSQKNHVGIGL